MKREQSKFVLFLVLASIAVLLAVWPLITDWMDRRTAASMPHSRMVVQNRIAPPPKVVSMDFEISDLYDDWLPVYRMGFAVRDNPAASQIQMSWAMMNPGGGDSATAVYDRRKHSLSLYSENRWSSGKVVHEDFLYTGVTDAILVKLGKDHYNETRQSIVSWFDSLPQYGCRRHKITAAQAARQLRRLSL